MLIPCPKIGSYLFCGSEKIPEISHQISLRIIQKISPTSFRRSAGRRFLRVSAQFNKGMARFRFRFLKNVSNSSGSEFGSWKNVSGLQKGPVERGHIKKRQKVSKSFSTLFDNFRAGQKTSKIVKKCQKVFRHFPTNFARHHFSGQGRILAAWILAAKLPNSDLNFAVDFLVDFFLLFYPRKKAREKSTEKSPVKVTRDFVQKNSPRISAEAFS